ncbi:MAG: hypothetical protein KAS30_04950 [Candidatus Diapherotrites archaeon]|nr:hypothetical protein [Candidatus Diapherotrites archaeon]
MTDKENESPETINKEEESTEETVEEIIEEDENKPFTNARVDRLMRKALTKKLMIRGKVRDSMNEFLGEIGSKATKEMGQTEYAYIEMDDFMKATEKYKKAEYLDEEKQRIVASLEKLKLDINALIRDLERL